MVFQNILNIFVFDSLEKFVQMNHVLRIHLQFQLKFLYHRVLKHQEYFFELAIRRKNRFKKKIFFDYFFLPHHDNVEQNVDV